MLKYPNILIFYVVSVFIKWGVITTLIIYYYIDSFIIKTLSSIHVANCAHFIQPSYLIAWPHFCHLCRARNCLCFSVLKTLNLWSSTRFDFDNQECFKHSLADIRFCFSLSSNDSIKLLASSEISSNSYGIEKYKT